MEKKTITWERSVSKEEEGNYISVPFAMPENVEEIKLSYEYDRSQNVIDLGLADGNGGFIGWSGSNRKSVTVSERKSSAGFAPCALNGGLWNALLGAYKVQEHGVLVTYTAELTMKSLRLLKGDPHLHSCGSDGNMTTDELAFVAEKEGLDYLFITDHNNYAHNYQLRSTDSVTLIPGVEWTNYKGHAGLLGRRRPFQKFTSNSPEETNEILETARNAGALVVLNHPFCPYCGWKWGLDNGNFDLIEIWNGALSMEHNLQCLDWWDQQLKLGKEIPITGGSDFHQIEAGRMMAMPCTCVYSMSNTAADILEALKMGNSFVTLSPDGPLLEADDTGILPGNHVPANTSVTLKLCGLKKNDRLRLIWKDGRDEILATESSMELTRTLPAEGYWRLEIRRRLWPEGEMIPVFLSNPFYMI